MIVDHSLALRALRHVVSSAIVALSILSCSHTRIPPAVDYAAVERVLEQHRQEQHVPGMAFVIVRDDRVAYEKMFGVRDVEHKLAVTPDTLFPIGSCTKAFTSMAAALSQDRGLLSLDDHPRKYLPYLKFADPETDAAVTLRDMLGHRTGLKAYADLAAEPGLLTREEYIRAAASAKPAVPFRTKFQYSNAMYSAMGEIIGKVNRSTWEQVVEDQIFLPLQMNSSVANLSEALAKPDHVTGYVFEGGALRPVPPPKSLGALAPGGAIASSTRDMTQWVRMLSNSGVIDGHRFVSTSGFRELTSPLMTVSPTISYALGWATYDWNGLRVVEHNGGSQGISALISFIPERHIGFVLLANTSPGWLTKVTNLGNVIWPILLAADDHPSATKTTVTASTPVASEAVPIDAPSVDSLLVRMLDASGNREKILSHHTVRMSATKRYENQGITADVTIEGAAPAQHNEEEIWHAAGREIARLRIYFDGENGGQETTFGQDAINTADDNVRVRREYALHPLLGMRESFAQIKVQIEALVGDEAVWVLELSPEKGTPTLLSVSKQSALIVQRESNGITESFSDYRDVDGEMVPFHRVINDEVGESTVTVRDVRFNEAIDQAEFRARK